MMDAFVEHMVQLLSKALGQSMRLSKALFGESWLHEVGSCVCGQRV